MTSEAVLNYMPIDHPRFRRVQVDIFTKRVVPDCMTHRCSLVKLGSRERLDACCSYGADVDLAERDQILSHRDEIAALLLPEVRDRPWFRPEEKPDNDFPSGAFVRTETAHDGCIFLAHDRRGCSIHRASIEGGWDFDGVKPHVCRLFPLSYESDGIVISDDYDDYSCAYDNQAPSVYRVGRASLEAIFGSALVVALDRAEAKCLDSSVPAATTHLG